MHPYTRALIGILCFMSLGSAGGALLGYHFYALKAGGAALTFGDWLSAAGQSGAGAWCLFGIVASVLFVIGRRTAP